MTHQNYLYLLCSCSFLDEHSLKLEIYPFHTWQRKDYMLYIWLWNCASNHHFVNWFRRKIMFSLLSWEKRKTQHFSINAVCKNRYKSWAVTLWRSFQERQKLHKGAFQYALICLPLLLYSHQLELSIARRCSNCPLHVLSRGRYRRSSSHSSTLSSLSRISSAGVDYFIISSSLLWS